MSTATSSEVWARTPGAPSAPAVSHLDAQVQMWRGALASCRRSWLSLLFLFELMLSVAGQDTICAVVQDRCCAIIWLTNDYHDSDAVGHLHGILHVRMLS